jgi:hypothetical protein
VIQTPTLSREEFQTSIPGGRALLEYLGTTDFERLKHGEALTFFTERRQEITDLTSCSRELVTGL